MVQLFLEVKIDARLYADDSPPAGRYDRYSNEYARYIWEAAGRVCFVSQSSQANR
ncbi:MAG TPA: hypothetical protein VK868_07535 [Pyrinomonadaceae bacterium]|nr:hypothetical protein [Pyrinomonadaceae bacterium]